MPMPITEFDKRAEFVDREKMFDAIRKFFRRVTRVIGKRFGSFAPFPTAVFILQNLRQIPMIKRRKRLNSVFQKFVNEFVVKIQTFRIRLARCRREKRATTKLKNDNFSRRGFSSTEYLLCSDDNGRQQHRPSRR